MPPKLIIHLYEGNPHISPFTKTKHARGCQWEDSGVRGSGSCASSVGFHVRASGQCILNEYVLFLTKIGYGTVGKATRMHK